MAAQSRSTDRPTVGCSGGYSVQLRAATSRARASCSRPRASSGESSEVGDTEVIMQAARHKVHPIYSAPMNVQIAGAAPPASGRSGRGAIVSATGALVLAVVAALAAQMGIPRAQPLVGAIVILGLAYGFSTDRRAIDR